MSGRASRRRSQPPDSGLDPTWMTSQPSLRTSSGGIWLLMASLFAMLSLALLIAIVVNGGPAASVALVTATLVVGLLIAMEVVRRVVGEGPPRLRALAGCFLSMALIALAGMVVCVMIVWIPVTR
jgi:hypothetical protein